MIEQARASVPPSLKNVRFVCCDLAALDLPNAMANVVISNCAINHAADKQAVYGEIRRILRPGGRFVVSDVIAEAELPESVKSDPAAWAACYGGAIPEPQYLGAIRGAGFAGVEVLRRSEPYEKGGVLVRSLTVRGTR
jgi:SAM-dependent methyltransferase